MRISDWSSDWCLPLFGDPFVGAAAVALLVHAEPCGLVAVPAGVAELLVLRADVALHVEVVAGFPVAVLAGVPPLVELGVAPVGAVPPGGVVPARTSVGWGKLVSVRVALGGHRI